MDVLSAGVVDGQNVFESTCYDISCSHCFYLNGYIKMKNEMR